jgi:hypothetical protein
VWVPGANQNVTPGRFQLTALLSPAATVTEPAGAVDGPVNSDASPHTDTGGDAGNDDATAAFKALVERTGAALAAPARNGAPTSDKAAPSVARANVRRYV